MANPETGRLKKRGAKLSGLIEDFERGNWRNLLRKFESEKWKMEKGEGGEGEGEEEEEEEESWGFFSFFL